MLFDVATYIIQLINVIPMLYAGWVATNRASYERVRALIAVIFFFCRFCFVITNYIYVIAITFKDIRNCMPMGMLHVRLAATAKQPMLTNSLSGSGLVGWACTHA